MQKMCANCGSPLEENVFVCPNCGALPGTEPVYVHQSVPFNEAASTDSNSDSRKASKGFRWWMAAVPAAVAVIVIMALFWQSLLMLVNPKAALRLAMADTVDALAMRYDEGPGTVLKNAAGFLDNGELTVDADISSGDQQIGLGLSVGINREMRQAVAGAVLQINDLSLAGDLYLDPEVVAASADFLNDGAYYGVTFDTFREDARQSFLTDYLSDEEIDALDELIQMLVDLYDADTEYEALLEPYTAIVMDYILAREATRNSDRIELDGNMLTCNTVGFTLEEQSVVDMMELLIDMLEDDEALKERICMDIITEVTGNDMDEMWRQFITVLRDTVKDISEDADVTTDVIFYVRRNRVVRVFMKAFVQTDATAGDICLDINFGSKPGAGDIVYTLSEESENDSMTYTLTSKVTNDDFIFRERLLFVMEYADGDTADLELGYKWNKDNGKLTMSLAYGYDGEMNDEYAITCNLRGLENGFVFTVDQDDLANMLDAMGISLDADFMVSIACTEGIEIHKPSFTNLDKWDAALLQEFRDAIHETFYPDFDEASLNAA